jgi:hypothetical protein
MVHGHMGGLLASIPDPQQKGVEHECNGFHRLWNDDRHQMEEQSNHLYGSTSVPNCHLDRVRQSSLNHLSQTALRHHYASALWKIYRAWNWETNIKKWKYERYDVMHCTLFLYSEPILSGDTCTWSSYV